MALPSRGSRPPVSGWSASSASRYIGVSGTRTRWRLVEIGRVQIGQRLGVIEPAHSGIKPSTSCKHAVGAVDETAQDLARICIRAAIASLVEPTVRRERRSSGGGK